MADIYSWDVTVSGPKEAIGTIDSTNLVGEVSTDKTGISLGTVTAKNTGTGAGVINIKLYEKPGTAEETQLYSDSAAVALDSTYEFEISPIDTPSEGGVWPLGIKVWGEDESEPSWTAAAGSTVLGNVISR